MKTSKALTLADKGTHFAQKGKSKIIDPAKEKLHLVENKFDQIRHTERHNTKVCTCKSKHMR